MVCDSFTYVSWFVTHSETCHVTYMNDCHVKHPVQRTMATRELTGAKRPLRCEVSIYLNESRTMKHRLSTYINESCHTHERLPCQTSSEQWRHVPSNMGRRATSHGTSGGGRWRRGGGSGETRGRGGIQLLMCVRMHVMQDYLLGRVLEYSCADIYLYVYTVRKNV